MVNDIFHHGREHVKLAGGQSSSTKTDNRQTWRHAEIVGRKQEVHGHCSRTLGTLSACVGSVSPGRTAVEQLLVKCPSHIRQKLKHPIEVEHFFFFKS